MMPAQEITYRPRGRAEGPIIGAHRGRDVGGAGIFRDDVTFLQQPDARRINLRATLRDPFETVYVRRFEQRTAIAVYAVVDLSGSMAFEGNARKIDIAADLCVALAGSARRFGDAFGLIGCDDKIRDDFFIPATRRRGLDVETSRRFAEFVPTGRSAAGLAKAGELISGLRKLVFLISDFHLPLTAIEAALAGLARHDLAPIIIADSAEEENLPSWGLLSLRDLESGRNRLVAMRPALRDKWRTEAAERREALRRMFSFYGRTPFSIVDRLDVDRLSRHLLGA